MNPARAPEAKRLFVACDLPSDTGAGIAEWQRRTLAPRAELRVASTLHLTLCFLGDVPNARIPALEEALRAVSFSPLRLDVSGVLFLPARGAKRVVALELFDHGGALAALQADVSRALADRRPHTPEKRRFLPHVTVARYRHPGPPFSLQNVNVPGFCVSQMVLYSSLLERAGAVHVPAALFTAS